MKDQYPVAFHPTGLMDRAVVDDQIDGKGPILMGSPVL